MICPHPTPLCMQVLVAWIGGTISHLQGPISAFLYLQKQDIYEEMRALQGRWLDSVAWWSRPSSIPATASTAGRDGTGTAHREDTLDSSLPSASARHRKANPLEGGSSGSLPVICLDEDSHLEEDSSASSVCTPTPSPYISSTSRSRSKRKKNRFPITSIADDATNASAAVSCSAAGAGSEQLPSSMSSMDGQQLPSVSEERKSIGVDAV